MTTFENPFAKKIISPQEIEKRTQEIKQTHTIATLNGSFDILHAGHLYMLFEAKKQADVLLVALNSDTSIQGYKGPSRPIIPLKERLALLSFIEVVDYLTWFDELDPRELLRKVKPSVHVNGAEYGDECIEAQTVKEIGAALHLVERIDGLSTTQVIQKVVASCD